LKLKVRRFKEKREKSEVAEMARNLYLLNIPILGADKTNQIKRTLRNPLVLSFYSFNLLANERKNKMRLVPER
jgi:hypothetical protein